MFQASTFKSEGRIRRDLRNRIVELGADVRGGSRRVRLSCFECTWRGHHQCTGNGFQRNQCLSFFEIRFILQFFESQNAYAKLIQLIPREEYDRWFASEQQRLTRDRKQNLMMQVVVASIVLFEFDFEKLAIFIQYYFVSLIRTL